MTIEQIVELFGQIATWVTVVLVFFTLREMEKQRKASQKPELIIPNMSIFGYSNDSDLFFATRWSNKEISNGEVEERNYPQFSIYNIGTGAAKEISIMWDFDLLDVVKSIQDYCYRNSIPVVVSTQKDTLTIEYKKSKSYAMVKSTLNSEHAYLMPASVTSQGLKSILPFSFLELFSILIFLDIHKRHHKSDNRTAFPEEETGLESPRLHCALSYVDIGGEKYSKNFDVTFQPFVLKFPSKEVEFKSYEQVFQGIFEFIEKKRD
ncbi:MAG: hypothetical protein MHPDNHAH_02919 [Anaerolineales bacterium]|nr:hypothetical protein [Anaerolineales bacterium]